MINTKKIYKYIQSDYCRYTGRIGGIGEIVFYLLFKHNHCFNYNFWLRLASRKNPFYHIAIFMHKRMSTKYGIQIPRTTKIGYGFYIGHGLGVVINGGTIIGNNVNISQFLSIGTNKRTPATIGDNVYIGPNVCIVEDVKIGNDVTIGAGAVIVKDVPANCTAVGCPAKVISNNNHPEYVHNRYNIANE